MKRKEPHICRECGLCCHQFGISLTSQDINREPRLLDVAMPIDKIRNPKLIRYMRENGHELAIRKHHLGSRCVFLVAENECLIYETRPQVCRDFPGESICPREVENGNS